MKNGTPGEWAKAESLPSEELSSSPDKTEHIASILSITVKTSARVIT